LCGVFGFVLKEPVKTVKVFKVLQKLEKHQYPDEPKPVGGYGAGIAAFTSSSTVLLEKVGKVNGSPAAAYPKICKLDCVLVLMGHVWNSSIKFMETSIFREPAQPYIVQHAQHRSLNRELLQPSVFSIVWRCQ